MKKYVRKYIMRFLLGISVLSVEAVCDLLSPSYMSKMVDQGISGGRMDTIINYGIIMLGVTLIGAVAAVSRNIIATRVSQNFGADLRSDVFRIIQGFSFEDIDHFEKASLVTRLTNDVTQIQNFANGIMRIFVKAPILCVGAIVMMASLDGRLALVLLAVIPVAAGLMFASIKLGYPLFMRVQKAIDNMNSVTREYLSGVRVIKAFNRFDHEKERFNESNENLSGTTKKAMRIMAFFSPAITLLINLGVAAVLWIGGYRVSSGVLKIGVIMAFVTYMAQILQSLTILTNVFNMMVRAAASVNRINVILDHKKAGRTEMGISEGKPGETGITFKNVGFTYAGGALPAISDISFHIAPGETVGIIGPTGSGKTTLINLIPRFYETCEGTVRWMGTDIGKLSVHELRSRISVVPQNNLLFTGTISENIRWGKADASADEVTEACRVACADDFIRSFPKGYDTMVGQGGVNLSGGQKQRISIARALVRDPELLILDDCTSAVDVTTEARIRTALGNLKSDLMVIVISQRISSVMNADRIIVLDDGRMSGMGTHDRLMKDCEVYRDIYRSQIGKA